MSDSFSERLRQRRDSLKAKLLASEQRVKTLEQQVAELKSVMMRISGAIQVLDEEMATADAK